MPRSLTRLDLLVIGVAQIIGAGIFVISGVGVKSGTPALLAGGRRLHPGDPVLCRHLRPGNPGFLGLMLSMPASSWWRLGLWLLVGLAVYGFYGWRAGRFKEAGLRK